MQDSWKFEDLVFSWLALGLGLISYSFIIYLVEMILHLIGYEKLSVFDSVVLKDDDTNLCMPIGLMRLTKFEYESMKEHLIKKTADVHRGRSKLVKIFGQFYFQKITDAEFQAGIDKFIVRNDNIKTEKDLATYMSHLATFRNDIDYLQYNFTLVPDYKNGESLLISKMHHCMGDGLAAISFFLKISDDPDVKH